MFGYFEAAKKLNEEQIKALADASASLAKRFESAAAQAKDYSDKSFETSQTLVMHIDEAIKLYTDFVKTACQEFIIQSRRNRDLYANFSKEVLTSIGTAVAKFPVAGASEACPRALARMKGASAYFVQETSNDDDLAVPRLRRPYTR